MTSKLKVVISTHPRYSVPLEMLLNSLDFQNHKNDIILAFNETDNIELFKAKYETLNIVNTISNNYEYSAFASIGKAITDNNPVTKGTEWFFMMHDTTIAGPNFWKSLEFAYEVITLNKLTEESGLNGKTNCVSYSIVVNNVKRYLCNKLHIDFYEIENTDIYKASASWNILNGTRFESCVYPKRYINSNMKSLMPYHETNMQYKKGKRIDAIRDLKWLWRPLTNSFNIGFASAKLLEKCILYDTIKITKQIGIEMELNTNPSKEYPSLKMLSERSWSYFWKSDIQFLDSIDIYGTNKPRDKALLPIVDLSKYLIRPYKNEDYHTNSP